MHLTKAANNMFKCKQTNQICLPSKVSQLVNVK